MKFPIATLTAMLFSILLLTPAFAHEGKKEAGDGHHAMEKKEGSGTMDPHKSGAHPTAEGAAMKGEGSGMKEDYDEKKHGMKHSGMEEGSGSKMGAPAEASSGKMSEGSGMKN